MSESELQLLLRVAAVDGDPRFVDIRISHEEYRRLKAGIDQIAAANSEIERLEQDKARYHDKWLNSYERLFASRKETARLRKALANASSLARAAEPVFGWGARTMINDAWADGFRSACVEISDALLAEPEGGPDA
jgi:hypothetical protein